MGGKNFVGSFSYNVKDSEIIDECTKMAKQDGISFSEFVVACLKEQVAQKKATASEVMSLDAINIICRRQEDKPIQLDLTQWIDTVHQHKANTIMLTQIERISTSCAATARSYINQNRRFRRI